MCIYAHTHTQTCTHTDTHTHTHTYFLPARKVLTYWSISLAPQVDVLITNSENLKGCDTGERWSTIFGIHLFNNVYFYLKCSNNYYYRHVTCLQKVSYVAKRHILLCALIRHSGMEPDLIALAPRNHSSLVGYSRMGQV